MTGGVFKRFDKIAMDEENIAFMFPHNIHRKLRLLSEAKQSKTDEWKNFLLYVGPVILKGKLSRDYYEQFLLQYLVVRYLFYVKKLPVRMQ